MMSNPLIDYFTCIYVILNREVFCHTTYAIEVYNREMKEAKHIPYQYHRVDLLPVVHVDEYI